MNKEKLNEAILNILRRQTKIGISKELFINIYRCNLCGKDFYYESDPDKLFHHCDEFTKGELSKIGTYDAWRLVYDYIDVINNILGHIKVNSLDKVVIDI